MTDKKTIDKMIELSEELGLYNEQIICKYKFQDKEKFGGGPYCTCFCELCEDLPPCDDNCQIYEDFKQLTLKTQECEELKKEYTELKLENKELYRILADLKEVRKLKDHYRKALEEIEEELKEDIYCESQECGCDDFEECLKCTNEHILDIIDKAKDGE